MSFRALRWRVARASEGAAINPALASACIVRRCEQQPDDIRERESEACCYPCHLLSSEGVCSAQAKFRWPGAPYRRQREARLATLRRDGRSGLRDAWLAWGICGAVCATWRAIDCIAICFTPDPLARASAVRLACDTSSFCACCSSARFALPSEHFPAHSDHHC